MFRMTQTTIRAAKVKSLIDNLVVAFVGDNQSERNRSSRRLTPQAITLGNGSSISGRRRRRRRVPVVAEGTSVRSTWF